MGTRYRGAMRMWLRLGTAVVLAMGFGCSGSDNKSDGAGDGGTAGVGGSSGGGSGGAAGTATTGGNGGAGGNGGSAGSNGGTSAGNGGSGTGAAGGTGGSGGGPPGSVAMFVAQGHAGRTLISCDDGQTWVADRADLPDTETRCWSGDALDLECDHDASAGRGITYADGMFFATFGWGAPSTVRRSLDGVTWDVVHNMQSGHAGIAYGDDTLVTGNRYAAVSNDLGETWVEGEDTGLTVWNARHIGFGDGTFVIFGADEPDRDVIYSTDQGQSWQHPTTAPNGCIGGVGDILYGNGLFVGLGFGGDSCVSSDGGDTWTEGSTGGDVESESMVFDGSQFMAGGNGVRYSSADGLNWTTEPTSGGNVGAVGYSPETGTFVGVRAGWQVWYEEQRWYRSTDGLNWTEVSGPGSHPIWHIVHGYGQASDVCPAQ